MLTLTAVLAAFLPMMADTLPDISAPSLSDAAVGQILNASQTYLGTAKNLIATDGLDGR